MKKTLFTIIFALFVSISVSADSVGHGDLAAPSEWAIEEIGKAENFGMLDGFKVPFANDITREQFSVLSYNTIDALLKPVWEEKEDFLDTDNKKIAGLYNLGIIRGRGDGVFDPDGKITREEAATILYNLSQVLGYDTDNMVSTLEAYKDDADISDWARQNVYNIKKIGIMSGTDTGFMPKANITVEQAICTLYRLVDRYNSNNVTEKSFADGLDELIPDNENYVISPFSVKLALLMAANGAEGETKQQICDTLGVSDLEKENERIKALLESYGQSELLKLDVSNSIWINKDKTSQEFSPEYKEKTMQVFDAEADVVNTAGAKETINGWVSEKTNGKITEILNDENIDFWAMLINAVYFKGRWVNEFSKEATAPDIFKSRNGKEYEIDFMNKTGWLSYGEKDGVKMLELPYLTREDIFDDDGNFIETKRLEDMDISMYFLMSDDEFMAEEMINSVEIKPTFIELSLPKFKVEYSRDLSDTAKELGIVKAFEPQIAEFSPMFTRDTMWFTNIMHKTYINVDEEGTEAAAVTSVGMAGNSLPPEPVVLKFNKPFTFVIRDNINEEILFVGKYSFGN